MAKPQVYINVSQTLGILGLIAIGIHYLDIQADATGIQRTQFKDRIKKDIGKVIGGLVRPFGY